MLETVIDDIQNYERVVGEHAAGGLGATALASIAELAPRPLLLSVETGCGKSTILLSNLSERHICFTLDDTIWYPPGDTRGSLTFVRQCPPFHPESTTFIVGPTQRTVSTYKFDALIDFALIDGPHGYPFPDMEYYHLYPHLRSGAVLVIDDIHIPTIGRLFEFVSEDEMFEVIRVEGYTAFLRRTNAPTFDPERDGWNLQKFNTSRFGQTSEHSRIRELEGQIAEQSRIRHELESRLTSLKSRVAKLEARLAEAKGTLSDVSMKLADLRKSRLLKIGRVLRRLTGQAIPY
jgi:uncharacterized coiled-coil protein SlyX